MSEEAAAAGGGQNPNEGSLPSALVERVLDRLGVGRPEPDLAGLCSLYAAWCASVPFDNLRKMAGLAEDRNGPLPGDAATDFFDAWLATGAGGTCWAGNGALAALLTTLGFRATRGLATMMVAPDLPPNHGTVVVDLGRDRFLVDASMLFGEPLPLDGQAETSAGPPAHGVLCSSSEGKWIVRWRPLHLPDGLDCRIDRLTATPAEFRDFHERTRAWSPFNYQANVRIRRGDRVVGLAFGARVEIGPDGSFDTTVLDEASRRDVLTGEFGYAKDLVDRVPADQPTPPPPGSQTAAGS